MSKINANFSNNILLLEAMFYKQFFKAKQFVQEISADEPILNLYMDGIKVYFAKG